MPRTTSIATRLVLAMVIVFVGGSAWAQQTGNVEIRIGSKKFTESVILGEIAKHLASHSGLNAHHRSELGATRIVWNAVLAGELDLYPDYTGTLLREILVSENLNSVRELKQALANRGLRMTEPLGFNNTYALGMKKSLAESLNVRRISDLKNHPDLTFGFSDAFMARADGWPGLRQRYALTQENVRGLDHDLAYRGIESDTLQVIDLYSTDAEIDYYQLRTLSDDKQYFPAYNAIFVYRAELEQRAPAFVAQLRSLSGSIDESTMIAMNARAKLDGVAEAKVAADFLRERFDISVQVNATGVWKNIGMRATEHLVLVSISLACAIVMAIPLGILAAYRRKIGQVVLGVVTVIQTIPSLALFAFMIPLLGIGGPPAIVALFLYSLLPIVQNTYSGLHNIPAATRESAIALGLTTAQRLRLIELPLSIRAIVSGIKTSAVINVGTAVLAALIGAGGFGQPILTGIRLDNMSLIYQGAVPAALLALTVQGGFSLLERLLLPRGMRSNVTDKN